MTIKTVGVLGCGTMGSGLAEVCARGGYDVIVREVDDARVEAGLARVRQSFDRAVDRGKLSAADRDAAVARIRGTTQFEDFKDCDLVIEAVPEHLSMKEEVFRGLDPILPPHTILATNTSSLPVIELAVATARPTHVLGIHFFNPAPVMGLVEIIKTVVTDAGVIETARAFVEGLGKTPVVCQDRAGFIANMLLFPYLNNAARMLEGGFAAREDIDAAMQLGCAHPMGPLALLDLIGLDSTYEILDALYRQFRETQYTPAPLIKQLVTAGFLGRKTGRGFYEYEGPGSSRAKETGRHVRDVPDSAAAHIRKIGVLGSGTMASGVAEIAARAGFKVALRARTPQRACEAMAAVEKSMAKAVQGGKMTEDELAVATALIETSTDLDVFADCDLVIEAIVEDVDVKTEYFRKIDAIAPAHAILASATSSLPVIAMAAATTRPDQVVGMHFFNPTPVMRLIEIVKTVRTSEETTDASFALARRLGKHPVVSPDRAGFIVNALLFPYLNDAVRMVESGYARAEDVDTAMKLGCGHPVGPFQLIDIIGLDVTLQIISTLYAEFREPFYAPAPLLEHLVHAGFLGRKTGRGFYTY